MHSDTRKEAAQGKIVDMHSNTGVLHNPEIENHMNHYPVYPSSHAACVCARLWIRVCVCVTLRVRVCANVCK